MVRSIFRRLSAFRIIILGFAAAVLLGAGLLMLPVSSAAGVWTRFPDALFTAVSAVCVTGLVVEDTGTYWSFFGQAVILFLIQTGGMGVVTAALLLAAASGRRIGLMQRTTLQEAVSFPQLGGVVRMLWFIVRWTALFEGLGALLLAPVFVPDFGWGRGLWFAVFHSVSSFCNAGFDLTGVISPGSSLMAYAGHPVVNLTVMGLIIAGGLGFVTWADLSIHRGRIRRCRMQTKIILVMTAALILLPAVLFYAADFTSAEGSRRVWLSLFQSVTARTAGYNTADLSAMTEAGRLVLTALMLVGGSPGSTAGGMKTTAVFVLLAMTAAAFRQKEDVTGFGRRAAPESIRLAGAVAALYILLLLFGSLFISYSGFPALDALFETASAIGTVGLTVGVTGEAGDGVRCVLMLLMFLGRIGGMTLIYALCRQGGQVMSRLPEEKISVG